MYDSTRKLHIYSCCSSTPLNIRTKFSKESYNAKLGIFKEKQSVVLHVKGVMLLGD